MATKIFRQQQPAPKCGNRNTYTGCVLSQEYGPNQKAAKNAAKTSAINAAQPLVNQDRKRKCPVNCQPANIMGDKKPVTKEILSERINQAQPAKFVSYYTASWEVTIICPKPAKKKKK